MWKKILDTSGWKKVLAAPRWKTVLAALQVAKDSPCGKAAGIVLGLFAAGLIFRLPLLLNPATLNSDVAVVGIQARHMLQGEFSAFLWGTDYQSSFDALVLVPFFWLFGSTPTVAMTGPLLGFLVILALTFSILRRSLSLSQAATCCVLLVFTPRTVSQYVVNAPRIWSIAAVFLSVWFFNRASSERRPAVHFVLGGCALVIATFMDMYTLQWVPAVGLFGLLCSLDRTDGWRSSARRAAAGAVGGLLGWGLVALLRGERTGTSVTRLDFSLVKRNLAMLREPCGPWLFDFKGEISRNGVNVDVYQAAVLGRTFQIAGVLVLIALLLVPAVALFVRRLPWELRRTAALATATAACSVAGFLVSPSVVDVYSARYLTPVLWMAPLAVAVPAYLFAKNWKLLALLSPYLVVVWFSAWSVHCDGVEGGLPRQTPDGLAPREHALGDWLRAQGVKYAMADYWDAYRLTFLFEENPQVIPFRRFQDRHREIRGEIEAANPLALIFRDEETAARITRDIQRKPKGKGTFVQHAVKGYVVVLWTRTTSMGPATAGRQLGNLEAPP